MTEARESSSQETGLEEITDAELYRAFIADAQMDMHTAIACKVTAVSGRTVTVELAQNRSVPDGNGGYITEALPSLKGVPIADFVGGGMIITLPVAAGDYGMIICCERSIGAWLATGQQGDPGDLGMHTLDGAVFYPGLRPRSATPANASGTNMILGSDTNGGARIVIKPSGEIDLGANATDGIASGTKNDANMQALAHGISLIAPSPTTEPVASAIISAFATWIGAYQNTASATKKTEM